MARRSKTDTRNFTDISSFKKGGSVKKILTQKERNRFQRLMHYVSNRKSALWKEYQKLDVQHNVLRAKLRGY